MTFVAIVAGGLKVPVFRPSLPSALFLFFYWRQGNFYFKILEIGIIKNKIILLEKI